MAASSFLATARDIHNRKQYIFSTVNLSGWVSILLVFLGFPQTDPIFAQQEIVEEIVVTSTRSRRSFEEQPTRVEVLGGEEINEKANMKPGDIRMLLNETTGIQVQQTSPTSFSHNQDPKLCRWA